MNISSLINSSILINEHSHPLINCWTKERANHGSSWRCNKCTSVFTYDIPSFYCTLCDYDLCKQCLEKFNIGEVLIYNYDFQILNNISNPFNKFNWQLSFPCHNHFLTLILKENKNLNWTCKSCLKTFNNNESFFYCSICDYNLCQYCANKYPNDLHSINNLNSRVIKIIFDDKQSKQEMEFKYGTTVSDALLEYSNKNLANVMEFQFIYNNIFISSINLDKVEDFFNKNGFNYIVVMRNQMINPIFKLYENLEG